MPTLLLNMLSGILPDVIKRVLPAEKISEADQAQLAQALQLELMKQDWQQIEAEYKDRDSARGLAAQEIAKGNAFTSALAALVRPVAGFGCIYLVGHAHFAAMPLDANTAGIVQTVFQFYFGGRVIEKVLPMMAAGVASLKK